MWADVAVPYWALILTFLVFVVAVIAIILYHFCLQLAEDALRELEDLRYESKVLGGKADDFLAEIDSLKSENKDLKDHLPKFVLWVGDTRQGELFRKVNALPRDRFRDVKGQKDIVGLLPDDVVVFVGHNGPAEELDQAMLEVESRFFDSRWWYIP